MVSIRLEHVGKDRGGRPVLRDVDLVFPAGRTTALVGPSGSGKTTMLRLLAGLESPDRGRIQWEDRSTDEGPGGRSVAMLFQQLVLFPHLTVWDNLAFDLRYRRGGGIGAAEREEVDAVARRLGLSHLVERRPGELSGGEQQRVALGRALASKARVVLLDEPLAHLDAPRRLELQRVLIGWQRERGVTMVYVTHDGNEAIGVADQLAVLDRGRVVESGRPDDLLSHPARVETARQVGGLPANIIIDGKKGVPGERFAVRPDAIRMAAVGGSSHEPSEGRWRATGRIVDRCRTLAGPAAWVAVDRTPRGDFATDDDALLLVVTDVQWERGDRVEISIDARRATQLENEATDPARPVATGHE